MRQFLKDTLSALNTGGTVSAVSCKKQFHDQLTIFFDPSGVGVDYHSISRFFRTGSKSPASVILYCTQTACAKGRNLGMVAQCRYINACFTDYSQDIFFIGKLNFSTVNCHCTHNSASFLCFHINRIKVTVIFTGTAFDTYVIVDYMWMLDLS